MAYQVPAEDYIAPKMTVIGSLSTDTLKEVIDSIDGTFNGGKS